MNLETFCQQVREIAALPPVARHERFSQLHTQIASDYAAALQALTPEKAARPSHDGSAEARTVAQVVGHIAEWERFMILSAGDILAGLRHPRMITSLEGYVEPDGQQPAFATIDAFNQYQADKHAAWPWPQLQALALDTAATLHTLFTQPGLLNAERLEYTRPFRKRLPDGTVLKDLAMGWNLWITCLEHEGVEHAPDLELSH